MSHGDDPDYESRRTHGVDDAGSAGERRRPGRQAGPRIVALAAMFVAQAGIGVQLLTETDEEWDHAPTDVGVGFHREAMI